MSTARFLTTAQILALGRFNGRDQASIRAAGAGDARVFRLLQGLGLVARQPDTWLRFRITPEGIQARANGGAL